MLEDIDGNVRIWDGNDAAGAVVDMGAYEFGALPSLQGDLDVDAKVSAEDILFFAAQWHTEVNETNYRCDVVHDGKIDQNDLIFHLPYWR